MIKNFSVSGFKSLQDVKGSFQPINVIIGPNGAGKSSLLQSIDFLQGLVSSSIESYLKDKWYSYLDIPSLNKKSSKVSWKVDIYLTDEQTLIEHNYIYEVSVGKRRYPYVVSELLYPGNVDGNRDKAIPYLFRKGQTILAKNQQTESLDVLSTQRLPSSAMSLVDDSSSYPDLVRVRRFFESIRSYLLWDAKTLREPSQAWNRSIGSLGQDLAAFLKLLQLKHPRQWDELVRTVKAFIPSISEIRISGPAGGLKTIEVVETCPRQNVVYNRNQVSDGILRLLAIASLQYLPDPPSVITLEEPENGVHPQLLGRLVNILKRLPARRKSPTQVFISTHSPYLLDHFVEEPECVQVMEALPDCRGATLSCLGSRRDLRLAQRTLSKSLGELWYNNVLGGGAK